MWEKVAAKRPDEGCWTGARRGKSKRLRFYDFLMSSSVAHPSSVSALRADPPSPTRGEGMLRYPCEGVNRATSVWLSAG
ncbi:MAG: hypothetical protein EOS40_27190 [Mesorhizobium sp.]|nr:hypothetical protein EJ071_23725 [Mesorhizobium sp. M1B.F.Ca.ET.045.04.1.1]RWD97718.1 MAG: hypothetical protein EOS40_27190 [Mesorhizobium sp.]